MSSHLSLLIKTISNDSFTLWFQKIYTHPGLVFTRATVMSNIQSCDKYLDRHPYLRQNEKAGFSFWHELAMACDLRIAAENVLLGQPEIKIGVIRGGGGTQRLPRMMGVTKAKELLFTGDNIDANEAYRLGLINKVVPVDAAMDEARKVALKIVRQPVMGLRATKMAINGGLNMDIKSAMAYEARCFENLFFTEDQKEGTKAFLEKRKPVFKNR